MTPADSLATAFGRTADAGSATTEALQALTEMLAIARGAWPSIAIAPEDFAEAVGGAVMGEEDSALAIRALHASDLWLSCADDSECPDTMSCVYNVCTYLE